MSRAQFQRMLDIFADGLDNQDNKFRKGLKTDEILVLALSKLGDESTFFRGGNSWQRGKST